MSTHAAFDTGGRYRVVMANSFLPKWIIQRKRKYFGWKNVAHSEDFSACLFVAGRLEWPRNRDVRGILRSTSQVVQEIAEG